MKIPISESHVIDLEAPVLPAYEVRFSDLFWVIVFGPLRKRRVGFFLNSAIRPRYLGLPPFHSCFGSG
jgi:hypothetical protein